MSKDLDQIFFRCNPFFLFSSSLSSIIIDEIFFFGNFHLFFSNDNRPVIFLDFFFGNRCRQLMQVHHDEWSRGQQQQRDVAASLLKMMRCNLNDRDARGPNFKFFFIPLFLLISWENICNGVCDYGGMSVIQKKKIHRPVYVSCDLKLKFEKNNRIERNKNENWKN